MKDVILIRNALINGSRYLAGATVTVSDEHAKHLASLEVAYIPEPIVEEPKPVRAPARRKTTRKPVAKKVSE